MLKYVSRFFFEKIMPSVVATVAGAYIVNHYVASKPADAPAAAVATVDSKGPGTHADLKAAAKAADGVNVANMPEAGVRAKGISEKAIEKTPVEKVIGTKDRTASSASALPETKRATHDKAARSAPEETAAISNDRRDANDLARTVMERLREPGDAKTVRQANAPHGHEGPHAVVQEAVAMTPQPQAQVAPTPVPPLPPPVMISTPAPSAPAPDLKSKLREDRRLDIVPPADIPVSQPLDLEANAAPPPSRERSVTTVANDMLSAAKSVFQAVLPQ
ncbi:MAG TPA: hypothetical protein VHC94_11100 [Nitrobacter sp.]|jgi:hypothetical protein|nr:hypothetical protein [Nitrobacter sp.]